MQENNKKQKNKGFTLIELIIVMAIMAILVGALAPQVIKYVEKARESKDLQLTNVVFTAVQTVIASSEVEVGNITNLSLTDTDDTVSGTTTTVVGYIDSVYAEIEEALGADLDTDAEVKAKCSSKVGKAGTLSINYVAATGKISVSIVSGSDVIGPVTN